MQEYKVDIIANNELRIRRVFKSRTKAQKYILAKYNGYSSQRDIYSIRFVHFSIWGKYKKVNDMCIDSMNVQTKDLNIFVELNTI